MGDGLSDVDYVISDWPGSHMETVIQAVQDYSPEKKVGRFNLPNPFYAARYADLLGIEVMIESWSSDNHTIVEVDPPTDIYRPM